MIKKIIKGTGVESPRYSITLGRGAWSLGARHVLIGLRLANDRHFVLRKIL